MKLDDNILYVVYKKKNILYMFSIEDYFLESVVKIFYVVFFLFKLYICVVCINLFFSSFFFCSYELKLMKICLFVVNYILGLN